MRTERLSVEIGGVPLPQVTDVSFLTDALPFGNSGGWMEYRPGGTHIEVKTASFPSPYSGDYFGKSGALVVELNGATYRADDCRCTFVEGFCDGMGSASSTFAINDIQGGRFDEPSKD